jgi:threonine 3-dehydrogenase
VGVNRPGCFAEYLVIPAFNAFKIPDNISDDLASIFDPFGNAVHTALSFDLVGEDAGFRRRPDRHDGGCGGETRRRA